VLNEMSNFWFERLAHIVPILERCRAETVIQGSDESLRWWPGGRREKIKRCRSRRSCAVPYRLGMEGLQTRVRLRHSAAKGLKQATSYPMCSSHPHQSRGRSA